MSSDPNKIVQTFLEKNGFPFEMKVASQFQKAGFGIHQSVYYTDPQTNKPRELDIMALWHRQVANTYNFNVIFLIECKYAKTPWVLFSSITKGFPYCYHFNHNGKKWIDSLIKSPDFENFFEHNQKYGYGITTASNDSDEAKDNAFSALQTLLSFIKAEIKSPTYSTASDYTFFVPIIAIRGKLFEAFLDSQNETRSNEIKEAQIFYKQNINGIIPKIHIVVEEHLPTYINKISADCEKLFKQPYWHESIYAPTQIYNNNASRGSKHTY